MLNYFKLKRSRVPDESSGSLSVDQSPAIQIDDTDIVLDPGLRKPIQNFDVNMQDRIRRQYVVRGPCQPKGHNYPRKLYSGKDLRGFRDVWFENFDWLEYSISKDAAFCFYCFLFKHNINDNDAFTNDFSSTDRSLMPQELLTFLSDMKEDKRFSNLESLGRLAMKMKETAKDRVFLLVYKLVELVLLLPVATASVERVFSAMKYVKSDLRNRMSDGWLNDSLVVFVEKEIFAAIDNEVILKRFQDMETRRNQCLAVHQKFKYKM